MARKRMFDIEIVDTDLFLDMPVTARLLYYDFGMRADDDGFIGNPRKIMKITGASEDDLKLLYVKMLIIPFDTGICVIRHWKINNYIRKDRYTETLYTKEKKQLIEDGNGVYALGQPVVNQLATSGPPSIGKDSIGKDSIGSIDKKNIQKKKYGSYKNVLLSETELQSLKSSYDNHLELITYLDEYIEMKGYKAKSHYLCIKKWVNDAVKTQRSKGNLKSQNCNDNNQAMEELRNKYEGSGNNVL